jgi:hypothetical protein
MFHSLLDNGLFHFDKIIIQIHHVVKKNIWFLKTVKCRSDIILTIPTGAQNVLALHQDNPDRFHKH